MKTTKTTTKANECNAFEKIAFIVIKTYVDAQLKFDRKVLKRYLGIETPFYKRWHRGHVAYMQRQLDYSAHVKRGYETGMIF